MQLSAEWASVIVAALGLGFVVGGAVQRRRDANRNAIPIVRAIWKYGELGFTVTVELVNRLNEDLYVTRAECRSRFSKSIPGDYDPATSKVEFTYELTESPMDLDWKIPPNSKDLRSFSIDSAATQSWLRLTVSSSSKTLRSKRMVVTDSKRAHSIMKPNLR
jgi:hypothetical protein